MKELSLDNCRLDKRYDIFEQLGRGSYAEIFAARDTLAAEQSAHRLVAIKALNVFLQDDLDPDLERTLVENFQNEAVALDRVRHPNIISRLGHGTARDTRGTLFHYLVLEYLEGGDLQKLCRSGPLSLKQALKYIEQTCAGLRHAHNHGIIHRDIKPQNLLLTKDRLTVKIADFGVARIHASDAPITRVGTNIYAAPEHSPLNAGGDIMTVPTLTPAADIYSLGKTVYTLLTRESPRFYANQPITDLPLTVRNEEWAEGLKPVLEKATQREPSGRHQSVDEFWQDLEAVRRFSEDFETATNVRPKFHAVPQPHVAKGYLPVAPRQPKFDSSRDLKLRHQFGPAISGPALDLVNGAKPRHPALLPDAEPSAELGPSAVKNNSHVRIDIPNAYVAEAGRPQRKRTAFRSLAAVVVFLAMFAGGLFVTHSFLQNSGLLPAGIFGGASYPTGRANTDINLRPEPNTENDPIGLVTRNSRVRIVKMQNNWYEIDVIEQGRQRDDGSSATHGWLNGRYIDLDE
ncbi:MAG: protein kinase [Pyrinomonadaceae bacterium]